MFNNSFYSKKYHQRLIHLIDNISYKIYCAKHEGLGDKNYKEYKMYKSNCNKEVLLFSYHFGL